MNFQTLKSKQVSLAVPGRVMLAAGLLIAVTGLAKLTQRPGIDEPAFVPSDELASLPMELGGWRGEPSSIKDIFNQGLDAKFSIDRVYSAQTGQSVFLHMAAFDHFRVLAHHHPRICYGGAGWQVAKAEVLRIPVGDEPQDRPICELITFVNDTEQIYVLYWYQVVGKTTVRPEGVRALWWEVRNRRPLPPQVKVLMQTSAFDEEAARSAMLELAAPIYQWIKKACDEVKGGAGGSH